MGWGRSLWDRALITGWDRSLWGAHSLYGTGALIMGWRRSRWAAGRLYGSGAALQAPRRRSMAAPRSPRSPRPPSPPLRSPPSPPVLLGPRWRRMAADGGGWRRMTPAPLHSPWRRPARSSGRDRGKEAEVTSAEAAVLRKAGSCGVDDRAGSSASGGDGRAGSGVKRRAPEVELKGRAPEWRGRQ